MEQELTRNKKNLQELKKMSKRLKFAGYFWTLLSLGACIGIFIKVDLITPNVALIVILTAISSLSLMISKIIGVVEYLFENNINNE